MEYFAGLDVSLEETAVCVVDATGKILGEAKVASEPEAIAGYLLGTGVPMRRVGLEACPLSQWLYDGLAAAGLPAICIEVRHLKAALSAMTNKTDRNDARGIAQVMRTGWFRAVHVKSTRSHELKMLLTSRKLLVNKLLDVENQIRGSLKVFGLKVGKVSRRRFEARVLDLLGQRTTLLAIVRPLLRVHSVLLEEYGHLDRLVLQAARHDATCRRLMSVPGVGAVVALTFRAAVDVPARFTKSKAVGAHFGLVPRKHQSGEVDRTGHISKVGDAMVRTALYEAANVMLSRVVGFSALKAWALRVAQRRGMSKAKVALARKLAVILHRIWVDGTTFRWGLETSAAQA
jgi:transposase